MKVKETKVEVTPHRDTIVAIVMGIIGTLDPPALEYISDYTAELAEYKREARKNDK